MVRKVIIAIIQLLLAFALKAQVLGVLVFDDFDNVETCFQSKSSIDSLSAYTKFSRCISNFHGQGYLEARIDSISITATRITAFGYLGNQYQWATVSADSFSNAWLRRAGIRALRLVGKPLSLKSIGDVAQRMAGYLEDNGHPFASIEFANSEIRGNHFFSELRVNPGPHIRLDTLYILDNAKISRRFIESYIGFSKGAVYSESQILAYDTKLQGLPYVRVIRPTEVEFTPGKARVYTYLANHQASQFSGILGFTTEPDEKPRLRFTGDMNLQLLNVFGRGESNSFQWQAFAQGTQRLKIESEWHYLFGSSVGLTSNFNLFRRDTSYITINPKVDFNFPFNGGAASLGFDYREAKATSSGSGVGNSTTLLYAASLSVGQPLQGVFPVKDFWAKTAFGVGQRNEKLNSSRNSISSVVGELSVELMGYYPLYLHRLVLKAGVQGQMLNYIKKNAPTDVFYENELYRIGGFGSLRGFNQESIITSAYAVSQAELQLRIERIFNVYLFFDQGVLSSYEHTYSSVHTPFGAGFGFQLASAGGLFSMSYALGNGLGESLSFKNAKLHLGFTARF